MAESACIFCRIAGGELGTSFVYQDGAVVAFRDMAPQAPTHVLVIPRSHLASLAATGATDDALLGQVLCGVRAVASELGLNAGGYRTVINTGEAAGQSVQHLHAHVLAGRPMGWPPG